MTPSVYVFDAYGTLFDVHAAARAHASALGPDAAALSALWRRKQLEYSWTHALMGDWRDFWTLTERALDHALATFPSVPREARVTLLDSYWTIDCYDEVPSVLHALKARGGRIALLSNGTRAMLDAAVKRAGLDMLIDDVFSADAVCRYKTDPALYEMVTTGYRLYPEAVSFQSANRWDVAGAACFGFRTVWINREAQADEYPDHAPDLILPSLKSLEMHA
ncbi:haloacid dehalogenase, type II [Xaviernesmea oryzae]|uniref:(S)-2-haloacid dehalogenase n=1 Tax=Xaviernesmea oryzae TaxID=464029 RepID=A0A1Q9B0U0_9HYPH|nr:haloacid dehalogenase type II [Xaviernesmea oryzae]OLP61580.1 haloacid dehalogenase, type II [Xaviernesmea oryzae]SEL07622.1 2-haloacid dehalogenase [Xaviernesmea oryzae]